MLDELSEIFSTIELNSIDSAENVTDSKQFHDLMKLFPNLNPIFKQALVYNKDEFIRTIKHIFRVCKVLFQLKNGAFSHDTLSTESILTIREEIVKYLNMNENLIPLILIYHDIGRVFDRKNHPYKSYQLISENNLLDSYDLSEIDQLLIIKIIQYHLLQATIFTGESTFYGIYSLIFDKELIPIISKKQTREIFLDLLNIFTFIDILGYNYAKIYDHYVDFYAEINSILKEILNPWPDKEFILKKAYSYSQKWLEWRIAGALRIFQFIHTKPYLTKEFYYNLIRDSVKVSKSSLINKIDWEDLKNIHLSDTYKIQIKYGLGVLMILSFGVFFRSWLKEDIKVSDNLIIFWILLSHEVQSRSKGRNKWLWNVYFTGLPHWSKWNRDTFSKINPEIIEKIIQSSTHKLNENTKIFELYLDFKLD
ncbi:MAG: hypothetical protein ACFE8J_16380 [Candidatus Heimdallarchaeota archaeon]